MSRHGRKRQLDVESRYWRLLMSGLDGYTTSRQRGSGMPPTMTYGQRPRWADVYARVAATGTDLRGQLEALVQAAHGDVDPDDFETVRAALFAAHGRGPGAAR